MASSQSLPLPRWAIDIGWDIDRIVAESPAMANWQERVQLWARELAQRNVDGDQFDQEREQYFAEDVKQNPELRDRNQREYREKGYLWEHDPAGETHAMSDLGVPLVGGWVPPELSGNQKPKADLPLPIELGRELSLSEKFTILAVLHDLVAMGQPAIDPWTAQVDGSAMLEGHPYSFLLVAGSDKGELFEDHYELAFRSYLEHVKANVAEHSAGGVESQTPSLREFIETYRATPEGKNATHRTIGLACLKAYPKHPELINKTEKQIRNTVNTRMNYTPCSQDNHGNPKKPK